MIFTRQMRANAAHAAGEATKRIHHKKPAEIDWDTAITNLKAMLNQTEENHP